MASDKTPQSDNIEKPLLGSSDNTATLFKVYSEDDQIIRQPCSRCIFRKGSDNSAPLYIQKIPWNTVR